VNRRAGNYNNGGDYYPSQQTQGYQSYPQNSGAYGTPSYQATPPVVQTAPTLPAASSYPVAKRTSDPDVVTSPFDPTRKIGVKGYKSGDLVRDPKNKQIFRVP